MILILFDMITQAQFDDVCFEYEFMLNFYEVKDKFNLSFNICLISLLTYVLRFHILITLYRCKCISMLPC